MCKITKSLPPQNDPTKPTLSLEKCAAFLLVEGYAKERGEKEPDWKDCSNYDSRKRPVFVKSGFESSDGKTVGAAKMGKDKENKSRSEETKEPLSVIKSVNNGGGLPTKSSGAMDWIIRMSSSGTKK